MPAPRFFAPILRQNPSVSYRKNPYITEATQGESNENKFRL